ncbi:MAG: hypothetical protein RSB59_03370 [Clostridia bacterium]
MKKNLEKIFASASVVVAIVLIMILLVTAFGGISLDEFNSKLVRGLLITLGVLYILLSTVVLTLAFTSNEVIKEITMRSEQEGSVKATIAVVRKMTKDTCAQVEGVKCTRVSIITNDYGVRLRVEVKIKDKDVAETELLVRGMLEDKFAGALGFRFHSIEIKITSLQSKYEINKEAVDQKVATKLAAIKEEAVKIAESVENADEAETAEITTAIAESAEAIALNDEATKEADATAELTELPEVETANDEIETAESDIENDDTISPINTTKNVVDDTNN